MKKILLIMCLIALCGCDKVAGHYQNCNNACRYYDNGKTKMIEGCFESCINQPREN